MLDLREDLVGVVGRLLRLTFVHEDVNHDVDEEDEDDEEEPDVDEFNGSRGGQGVGHIGKESVENQ